MLPHPDPPHEHPPYSNPSSRRRWSCVTFTSNSLAKCVPSRAPVSFSPSLPFLIPPVHFSFSLSDHDFYLAKAFYLAVRTTSSLPDASTPSPSSLAASQGSDSPKDEWNALVQLEQRFKGSAHPFPPSCLTLAYIFPLSLILTLLRTLTLPHIPTTFASYLCLALGFKKELKMIEEKRLAAERRQKRLDEERRKAMLKQREKERKAREQMLEEERKELIKQGAIGPKDPWPPYVSYLAPSPSLSL